MSQEKTHDLHDFMKQLQDRMAAPTMYIHFCALQ